MAKHRNDSSPENVILGAYFAGKRHPQHGQAVTASSFDYFAGWYHSICRLGLHGVLLHDHLSEAFAAKYEQWFATLGGTARGGSFRFQRVHPGDFTAGDERFFLFRDYLKGNQANLTRHVFIVDVADAWFRCDPFRLIAKRSFWNYLDLTGLVDAARCSAGWEQDPFLSPEGLAGWWRNQREHLAKRRAYRLFLGAEDTRIGNNPWMLKHFDQVYGRRFEELNDKPVLNCGVIGGSLEDVTLLLEQVCAEMQSLQVRAVLNDMVVFNRILHDKWAGTVYSGGALNAPWKRWRKKGRHAIFHK